MLSLPNYVGVGSGCELIILGGKPYVDQIYLQNLWFYFDAR